MCSYRVNQFQILAMHLTINSTRISSHYSYTELFLYHNKCIYFIIFFFIFYYQSDNDRSVVSSGTLVSSTNKTECHDITEILLKVALNSINPIWLKSDLSHAPLSNVSWHGQSEETSLQSDTMYHPIKITLVRLSQSY